MMGVAGLAPRRMMAFMPTPDDQADEQKLLGRALAVLRKRADITQDAAADRMGWTSGEAWRKYETGKVAQVTDPEMQGRLARAVEATREELMREHALLADRAAGPIPGHGRDRATSAYELPISGRVQAGAMGSQVYDAEPPPARTIDLFQLIGPNSGVLELAGESMLPWGEPGEVIIFDREREPRRGFGCVVETLAGEYYVKLYKKRENGVLTVQQLNPPEDLTFRLAELKGVYRVRLRGD